MGRLAAGLCIQVAAQPCCLAMVRLESMKGVRKVGVYLRVQNSFESALEEFPVYCMHGRVKFSGESLRTEENKTFFLSTAQNPRISGFNSYSRSKENRESRGVAQASTERSRG